MTVDNDKDNEEQEDDEGLVETPPTRKKCMTNNNLAPFTPTMPQVQKVAIQMMQLTSSDVLFDLGCGDGRLLVAAAQAVPGIHCVGVVLDPMYADRANMILRSLQNDICQRIHIREGDVLNDRILRGGGMTTAAGGKDFNFMEDATAVFLFLMPRGLETIRPLMEQVAWTRKEQGKPFRVISYIFTIKSWTAVQMDKSTKGDVGIYLYDQSSIDFG